LINVEGRSEREIVRRIRETLNAIPDVRFFRNNCGVDTTRGVRYGLGVGSADLIGLVAGKFVALECKTMKGRLSDDQRLWMAAVRRLGGVAEVVRSVEEALAVVQRVRESIS